MRDLATMGFDGQTELVLNLCERVSGRLLRGPKGRRLFSQLRISFSDQSIELVPFRGVLAREAFEGLLRFGADAIECSLSLRVFGREPSKFGLARQSGALVVFSISDATLLELACLPPDVSGLIDEALPGFLRCLACLDDISLERLARGDFLREPFVERCLAMCRLLRSGGRALLGLLACRFRFCELLFECLTGRRGVRQRRAELRFASRQPLGGSGSLRRPLVPGLCERRLGAAQSLFEGGVDRGRLCQLGVVLRLTRGEVCRGSLQL